MAIEAQILANRLNAKKLTGPKIPLGKAVVSQNALKHGLTTLHAVCNTQPVLRSLDEGGYHINYAKQSQFYWIPKEHKCFLIELL